MKVCMFPGQGSQITGMGKELFGNYSEIIEETDKILGYSIEELCIDPLKTEILNQTQYTQPALYVINSLSYLEYLKRSDPPEYLIGHSLGEYNALFAAGAIDYKTGLRLVQKRGELMGKISNGAMAAVIGIELQTVKKILKDYHLDRIDIANINSYTQIIIAGPAEDLFVSKKFFTSNGARFMPLKVSGAFHSRYMKEITFEFKEILQNTMFKCLSIPVISNFTAREYLKDQIEINLLQQISSPVRWTETIEYLVNKGVTEYVQIGPGTVLTKLHKNIMLYK